MRMHQEGGVIVPTLERGNDKGLVDFLLGVA